MSAHTPGPWIVARGSTGRHKAPTIEVRAAGAPHEASQGIATVVGITAGPANAKLIAAAPAMLATLRRIHSSLDRYEDAELRGYIKEAAAIAIAEATA